MTTSSNSGTSDASPPPEPVLSSIADDMVRAAEKDDGRVEAMVEQAGADGLLPIMTCLGLILVSPLSGIPLFSTSVGMMIALCASQAAMGRDKLWLPGFLRRRQVDPDRVVSAMGYVRRAARWLEARAAPRLEWLSVPPARTVFLGLAALYGLSMPLMEVVPFTSTLFGAAVVMVGLGLILRDGILLLLSTLPPVIAALVLTTIFAG
ncbi:exopolysaccharide biosynthesis protein [Jannaschia sp. CCS1]|uniref:exopolysaccharide biosynthesis protein n=1 Tax=Jannaschia sp. (strain CCS1) TaxID=290400 RepID=UPI00030F878C|nr:exopolysaccharide biosynthesis protein [Jannaschia sp. CCS1]